MKKYCRYCSHCHYSDGCYCEVKNKFVSESTAKTVNTCKDFEFCELDVFYFGDMTKTYKPRVKKVDECKRMQMRIEV